MKNVLAIILICIASGSLIKTFYPIVMPTSSVWAFVATLVGLILMVTITGVFVFNKALKYFQKNHDG